MNHQRSQQKLTLLISTLIIGTMGQSVNWSSRGKHYARFGDAEIFRNATYWKCDRITCPLDADRCFVSVDKSPLDQTMLLRENSCFSSDEMVLRQLIVEDEAFDPYRSNLFKVTVSRNGVTSSSSTYGTANNMLYNAGIYEVKMGKKLNLHLDDLGEKISSNVNSQMRNLNQALSNMHSSLSNMFRF